MQFQVFKYNHIHDDKGIIFALPTLCEGNPDIDVSNEIFLHSQ